MRKIKPREEKRWVQCAWCGTWFLAAGRDAKYCSKACGVKFRRVLQKQEDAAWFKKNGRVPAKYQHR